MLLTPKTVADQIMMDLHHHCAEDPITGAYLIKSLGRRKLGRRTKFWYREPGMINARVIYATSVEDAIIQIEGEIEVPAGGSQPSA